MAGIAAATAASNSRRTLWWFLAAAATMGAITQHQIAGFTGVGLILVWLLAAVLDTRLGGAGADDAPLWRAIHHRQAFFAAAAGALLIGALYAVFIDFRFGELWEYLTFYSTQRAGVGEQGGYLNILQKHFDAAFATLPARLRYISLSSIGLASVLLVLTPVMPNRRLTFALLAPPLIIGGAYFFSLGFYGNWHYGYVILIQMASAWAGGASIAILVTLARDWWPRFGHKGEILLTLAVVAALVWEGRLFLERPSNMQKEATEWVNIEDYVDSVLAPMPPRARVWGTTQFGYESALRTDYLQLGDGMVLAQRFKPDKRQSIAPDFVVLGYRELNDSFATMLKDPSAYTPLKNLDRILPKSRFELIRLIKAPPYGTTRVYRQVSKDAPFSPALPSVRANDGRSRQWASRLLEPVNHAFEVTDGVSFELPFRGKTLRATPKAGGARVGHLPAGVYLIETEVSRKSGGEAGFLAATGTNKVQGLGPETGFGFEIAPYYTGTGSVSLLIRHGGGALYISQFDADASAGFRVTTVRPLEVISQKTKKHNLPLFKQWAPATPAIRILGRGPDVLDVTGDATAWGYQLISPNISVPPKTLVTVTLPVDVKTGSVGWGVLDQRGDWLLPPKANRRRATFNAGPSKRVKIVFSNLGPKVQDSPSAFSVQAGTLETISGGEAGTYQEDLLRCHETRRARNPEDCQ
ncbi:MAG: hypothetical protein HQ512_11765 [Rhodospirillales bacterium]|nr:hypothetical protein [Rhodospirillales bacterium]